ncbi:MAG: prepilin-type N-terminal cleavage/methylation domain-containing protein [Fimbriimonas sp.]
MRKAFSLLELLVVIAILALLAAVLFPVFARAKQEAVRTSCISNLRQTGVAMGLYQTDANGLCPVGTLHYWQNVGPGGVPFPKSGTRDVIEPLQLYAKGVAALSCPITDHRFLPRWVVNVGDKKGDRLMVPHPSNILTQCMHHLDKGWNGGKNWERFTPVEGRSGNHLALRADLSVDKVDSQSLRSMTWKVQNGEEIWEPWPTGGDFGMRLGVFQSEQWPPEWIQLPEAIGLNWNYSQ